MILEITKSFSVYKIIKKITLAQSYSNNSSVIVGDKALSALAATPKNVITETKRQMENN